MKCAIWSPVIVAVFVFLSFVFGQEDCGKPEIYHNSEDENPIVFVGRRLFFICSTNSSFKAVSWYFNEVEYMNGSPSNIVIDNINNMTSSVLRFLSVSASLNRTMVFCSVTYNNTCVANSIERQILVQGRLSPVINLASTLNFTCQPFGSILLTWEEPFTLKVPQAKRITYDVVVSYNNTEVVNKTTNTIYLYTIPNIDPSTINCEKFNATVTPNNNVGAGDADCITSNKICQEMTVQVEVMSAKHLQGNMFKYLIKTMPAICDSNPHIELSSNMTEDNKFSNASFNITSVTVQTNCSEKSIVTILAVLKKKRKYQALYNFKDAKFASENILSTFTVQKYRFKSDSVNETILEVDYLDNTYIYGALLIIQRKTFNLQIVLIRPGSEMRYELESSSQLANSYIYDIGENGFVADGLNYPAESQLNTPDLKLNYETDNTCSVTNTNHTIIYNCFCENDTIQVILKPQNDDSGKIFAERGSCNISSTVMISNFGIYDVLIFVLGEMEEEVLYTGNITIVDLTTPSTTKFHDMTSSFPTKSPDMTSSFPTKSPGITSIIIGITVGAAVLILIVLLIVAIAGLEKRRKRRKYSTQDLMLKKKEDTAAKSSLDV